MEFPILQTILLCFFYFFLLINGFYVLLLSLSVPLIYNRFRRVSVDPPINMLQSETLPFVGIIIPLHNEGEAAVNAVENALNLQYQHLEVVAVNDESDNNTLDLLKEHFHLKQAVGKSEKHFETAEIVGVYRSSAYPNLIVVDKKSRKSKADAVNAGINEANTEIVVVVDADTVLEKDAVLRMIRPFYEEGVVGQGGTLRILNGCKVKNGQIEEVGIPNNVWSGIQVAEYLRAFLYGRLGWNLMGGPVIISGAFGVFRRDALIEVGGFDYTSIGEDFELTSRLQMRMREKGHKKVIRFIPDPIAWTMGPETLKTLANQRIRWHQGLIEVLWKYRKMCFNPKYGMAGMLSYPYMLLGEFIEPIIETFAILLVFYGIAIGLFPWMYLLLVISFTWVITMGLSAASIFLEITTFRRYIKASQIFKLLGYSLLENFMLRPLYLGWRFVGIWRYIRGSTKW